MNDKKMRIESDLIGQMEVPADVLYGVQTLRGLENFSISHFRLSDYPQFINGLAITKMAAAEANHQLGLLSDEQYQAIVQACTEILAGEHHDQFPVDIAPPRAEALNVHVAVIQSRGPSSFPFELISVEETAIMRDIVRLPDDF